MSSKSWFYNKGLKPQGPVTLEELRKKIMAGEVGPWDLVSCEEVSKGDGEWKPACEWRVFENRLFPAFQGGQEAVTLTDPQWVVLKAAADGQLKQEGPYTFEELRALVQSHQVSLEHYVWKTGLSGWCRVRDRVDLFSYEPELR